MARRKYKDFKLFIIFSLSLAVSAFFKFPRVVNSTATSSQPQGNNNNINMDASTLKNSATAGELERLKEEEARLAAMLASIRKQKLSALRSRPLNIGVIGFGRFGQFIGKSFTKYANVVGTSRSDYTQIANDMGAKYIPLSNLESFVLDEDLDVIVVAVSIVSFEDTLKDLVPHLKKRLETKGNCPLITDVLSVKEHARTMMLKHLPEECDILCTHPMFGPDSAKHGLWNGQKFVYERTRVDKVLLDPDIPRRDTAYRNLADNDSDVDSESGLFVDVQGVEHNMHENSESHVESMDRIERFLSIWEEEGCNMISMSCAHHDEYTANSQFITHLTGRILGAQESPRWYCFNL